MKRIVMTIIFLLSMFFLGACSHNHEEHQVLVLNYTNSSQPDLYDHYLYIAVGEEYDYINKIIEIDLESKSKNKNVIYESEAPYTRINSLMANESYLS